MDQNALRGTFATFEAIVTGSPPLQYQWRHNGGNILGATNAAYAISGVTDSDSGNYSVIVANSAGSATSSDAVLRVIVPPQLALQLLANYPVLRLQGALGSNFTVQHAASPDSTNWANLISISNLAVSPYQFLDPAGNSPPSRFYRATMW